MNHAPLNMPGMIAGQAAMAILVLVYLQFYLSRRESYLGLWTLAWALYFGRHIFMFLMPVQQQRLSPVPVFNGLCVVMGAYFLLAGTYRFLGRTPPAWPKPLLPLGYLWVLVAGMMGVDFLIATLPVTLAVAAVYVSVAWTLLRQQGLSRWNRYLAALVLLLWTPLQPMYALQDLFPAELVPWGYVAGVSFQVLTAITLLVIFFQKSSSDLIAAQAALQESEQKFALAFRLSPVSVVLTDLQSGKFIEVSEAFTDITGYTREEALGRTSLDMGIYTHLSVRQDLLRRIEATGSVRNFETVIRRKDGRKRTVLLFSEVVTLSGRPHLITCGMDISERKAAEEQLKRALEEKEILLREVHHRVKNNMQVVSSLLTLQESRINDPALLQVFQKSQARISALALVHQVIYQSRTQSCIDLQEYTSQLARRLMEAYDADPFRIELQVSARGVLVGMEQSVPCGLVLNELISNALKYAFPGDSRGTIRVEAGHNGDGRIVMKVMDDGVGMEPGLDWDAHPTLGLSLVRGLVEHQLAGRLRWEGEGGTRFIISFPVEQAAVREEARHWEQNRPGSNGGVAGPG